MGALAGLNRRLVDQLRTVRIVLDGDVPKNGTPKQPPLFINPTEPPSASTAAIEGAFYFDDDNHCLMQHNGSAWEEVGAGIAADAAFAGAVTVGTTLGVTGALTLTGAFYPGSTSSMTAGTGVTTGVGTVYSSRVYRQGSVIKTEIFTDLTGLNSGGADGDIIGKNSTANSHFGQVTTAVNGTIFKGCISCVETPGGGEPDIDVYCASVGTGTEDAAISGISGVALLAAAADWTQGAQKDFTGTLTADYYLYLVASGGVTDATYTAGQFFIELWGYV